MVSFRETWRQIHSAYRDNADTLGVPIGNIETGRLGEAGPLPLIYTYMIPARVERPGTWARFKTVVIVDSELTLEAGMSSAMALAARAIRVLKGLRMGLQWPDVAPEFEAADSDMVAISFEVLVPYDPLSEG